MQYFKKLAVFHTFPFPAFSSAFSSCIFHLCTLVPNVKVLHFPPLHFVIFGAAFSSPTFSFLAFSASLYHQDWLPGNPFRAEYRCSSFKYLINFSRSVPHGCKLHPCHPSASWYSIMVRWLGLLQMGPISSYVWDELCPTDALPTGQGSSKLRAEASQATACLAIIEAVLHLQGYLRIIYIAKN